jgi:phage baseplate assembly protein W
MAGINAQTGQALDGWEHTAQIFSTRIGTRVMRRDFGSNIPNLIDRPGTQDLIVDVVLAAAEALEKWEPRFQLRRLQVPQAGPDGIFAIDITGRYYPRGHLGDFSEYQDDVGATVRVRP